MRRKREIMLLFQNDDFQQAELANFTNVSVKLAWPELPEVVLPQIHLIRPEKFRALESQLLPFWKKLYASVYTPVKQSSSITEAFEFVRHREETINSIEETQKWLTDLEIAPEAEMVMSYDPMTALLLPWSIFLDSYDVFCYQSLEDICLCSTDERWYLLYYHEDIFVSGKRCLPGQDFF